MLVITLLLHLFFEGRTPEINDGYSNKLSVYPGDSLDLYLNATFYYEKYTIRLFDLSGEVIYSFKSTVFPQAERRERAYELGFGFKRTCRVALPELGSGVYLIEKRIPVIVKSRHAKITVVYPSNTVNAYSASGGKSLYGFNSTENKGAQVVSFHRPMGLPKHAEGFLRWIYAERFQDVGYVADIDLDDYKSISKSKLLIIPGHSEYWTLLARRNFDRFVQSGRNAMVLSGNTMWWQVRYNRTKDQLICYRDRKSDPIKNEKLKTINWYEPSLQYPIIASIGAEFRNAGYGNRVGDSGWDGYKITASSPLLEGTMIKIDDILELQSDETDGVPIASFQHGIPMIDYEQAVFSRIELVGYDRVQRAGKEGIATWIVFKPTAASGIVINTGSTDWCSARGIGSNPNIAIVTTNMIRKLMNDENVFSGNIDSNTLAN